nr:hypothetical protein [Kibdelosporangium phytohabitans]
MVLFFQFDIPADIPVFGGNHLLAFQCRHHDDVPFVESGPQLPDAFWDGPTNPGYPGPFWRLMLHRDETGPVGDTEKTFSARVLTLSAGSDGSADGDYWPLFKVGGEPDWVQSPESPRCPCGADMVFVCQVPESYGFSDEHEPYADDYMIFLGNAVYVLACPVRCHPAAVWPVPQN